MSPERWKQIEQVIHEALKCDLEDRSVFLAQRCDGDPEMRAEIESLISG
jgi:hypothetical protein